MFGLLIALGVFGGMVWVVSYAILLVMRVDRDDDTSPQYRDTIATFVRENYGSRFQNDNPIGEESLRKL